MDLGGVAQYHVGQINIVNGYNATITLNNNLYVDVLNMQSGATITGTTWLTIYQQTQNAGIGAATIFATSSLAAGTISTSSFYILGENAHRATLQLGSATATPTLNTNLTINDVYSTVNWQAGGVNVTMGKTVTNQGTFLADSRGQTMGTAGAPAGGNTWTFQNNNVLNMGRGTFQNVNSVAGPNARTFRVMAQGPGTDSFQIAGTATQDQTGTLTSVEDGTLLVSGDATYSAGTVAVTANTTLSVTGAFTASSGSMLNVDLTTPTAGSGLVSVAGTVTLGGSLDVTALPGFSGSAFTLIDNTGGSPVSGTFQGLPEGAILNVGGTNYQITYVGGDGNDVVLQTPTGSSTSPSLTPTSTSVSSSQDPSMFGAAVTFTASVSGGGMGGPSPTGMVTFYADDIALGSDSINMMGQASLAVNTLTVGDHTITALYSGDGNFSSSSGTLGCTVDPPVVTVNNPGNQTNTAGDTVSLGLLASASNGDSVTLSATGLPPGLTITSSGISGTIASDAGSTTPYSVTITATDASAGVSASQPFSWTVNAPTVSLMSPGNQTNAAGDTVSLGVLASASNGDSVTLSATGLPPGLTMTSSGISGTIASDAGSATPYSVTITATDAAADVSASQSFSWTVNAPTVTFMNPGNQTNTAGDTVSQSLMAWSSNGDAVTFSATGLPPGLSITSGGVISGTIGGSGTYTVTITATDVAADVYATQTFNWTVA